jgi:DNA-binding transcriptional regulator YdaS (Cro superfamily)
MHPFLRALDLVEPSAMAQALGVSLQMISKMKRSAEADPSYQVPATHLRAIQAVTNGEVTIDQLVVATPGPVDRQQAAA